MLYCELHHSQPGRPFLSCSSHQARSTQKTAHAHQKAYSSNGLSTQLRCPRASFLWVFGVYLAFSSWHCPFFPCSRNNPPASVVPPPPRRKDPPAPVCAPPRFLGHGRFLPSYWMTDNNPIRCIIVVFDWHYFLNRYQGREVSSSRPRILINPPHLGFVDGCFYFIPLGNCP